MNIKAGQIYEAEDRGYGAILFRVLPLPRKDRAGYVAMREEGWVRGQWLDAHGGRAHVHISGLRLVSNRDPR